MSIKQLEGFVHDAISAVAGWEGSADSAELAYLANIAKQKSIKTIGEIGFNAGLSSFTFLEANLEAHVYSFDLGEYGYVQKAKILIDKKFPGRHTLTLGDSLKTVPEFHLSNPKITFDLIFVDGGHSYETAKADLNNMKTFATKDTLLITDDLTPWLPWGEGPTLAWQEALKEGLVTQIEMFKDGKPINDIEPPGDRCWVLGRYCF